MKRHLSPAFVVTLAALAPACGKPAPTANTPDGMSQEPTGGKEQKALRTRPVRDPLPEWKQFTGRVDYANAKALNPRDSQSREMYAGRQGECYVNLPFPKGRPIPPPGSSQPTESVDCPDAMQDPAWDTCIGGNIMSTGSGECVCNQTGNPPPPPAQAECPQVK